VPFAICYIATKEAFLASILLSCEESIDQIRDGLKEKYEQYE
jgi:hypothetical protein